MGWAALAGVVLAVVGGAIAAQDRIVAVWPPTARIYAVFGFGPPSTQEAFELRGVKQSTFIEDEHTVVIITGEIVNVSSHPLPSPKIVARIFDANAKVLSEWVFDPVRAELGPGEITEFSDRFSDPPEGAVNLIVSLADDT